MKKYRIVIHCSATAADKDYTEQQLERDHLVRKINSPGGYHFYIRKDGTIIKMKDQETCRLSNRIMIVAPSSRLTDLDQLLSTHPELSERMVLIPGSNTLTEADPPVPPKLSEKQTPLKLLINAGKKHPGKLPKKRSSIKTSPEPIIPR